MEKKFNFHILAFLGAFTIGMIYIYISTPKPKIIIKYPNPYNCGKIVYRDKSDTCFVFKAKKVTCPTDKKKIKQQPISEK